MGIVSEVAASLPFIDDLNKVAQALYTTFWLNAWIDTRYFL